MNGLLDLLPLLNLLTLPAVLALWRLADRLARIETTQAEHARRLAYIDRQYRSHYPNQGQPQ